MYFEVLKSEIQHYEKFLQIKMNIMRASIIKYIPIIFFGVVNFMEKNLLPQKLMKIKKK